MLVFPDIIKLPYIYIDHGAFLCYLFLLAQGSLLDKDTPIDVSQRYSRRVYINCLKIIPLWQKRACATKMDLVASGLMVSDRPWKTLLIRLIDFAFRPGSQLKTSITSSHGIFTRKHAGWQQIKVFTNSMPSLLATPMYESMMPRELFCDEASGNCCRLIAYFDCTMINLQQSVKPNLRSICLQSWRILTKILSRMDPSLHSLPLPESPLLPWSSSICSSANLSKLNYRQRQMDCAINSSQ